MAAAILSVLGAFVGGCAETAPTLEGGTYQNGAVAFHVGDVPRGWSPIRVTAASLAWRDEADEASILLNARCSNRDEATPLRALGQQLLLGTTERNWTNEQTIPFDGREAIHGRVTAKLDGVPMSYDLFVLRKDGCIYDFVLVAPTPKIDPAVPAFEAFTGSFHTLRGSGRVSGGAT